MIGDNYTSRRFQIYVKMCGRLAVLALHYITFAIEKMHAYTLVHVNVQSNSVHYMKGKTVILIMVIHTTGCLK